MKPPSWAPLATPEIPTRSARIPEPTEKRKAARVEKKKAEKADSQYDQDGRDE